MGRGDFAFEALLMEWLVAVDLSDGMFEAEATCSGQRVMVRNKGLQRILGECRIQCMLHSVYAALGVCCTRCMLHTVYAALGVCCTRCMLHSVNAAHGVNS